MKASCTMYQKVKVWHAYLIFKEHFYTVAYPKIATRHLSNLWQLFMGEFKKLDNQSVWIFF